MRTTFIKKKKKNIKYLNLIGLKKDSFFFFPKFRLLKYHIFKKNLFIYKRSKFCNQKKNLLSTEIAEINFGFGDSDIPLRKTVFNVENYIIKYLLNIVSSVCYISFWKTTKRPTVHDILFLFRNDNKKIERIRYLLEMKNLIQMVMGSKKKNQLRQKKKF